VSAFVPSLVEFPADDPERARRFWSEVLGRPLEPRRAGEGSGWQTPAEAGGDRIGVSVGVHERGRGPGDSFSLPYFTVEDLPAALERVAALGGSVVHPGAAFAVCRDSEGSPFGLACA
jgi:predicted enzyme related to lactoylglutathione lyase